MQKTIFIFFLSVLLFLGGCSQTDDQTPADPPATKGNALVLGKAESPFLDSLSDRMTLTSYDGSQNLADHDALVFDGDHYTPGEVRDHKIVKQAVRSSMWVVGLDVTEEHKRQGLGDYVQASSGGNSPVYVVHMGQDANGRPEVYVLELPVGEQAGRSVSGRLGSEALSNVTVNRGAPADSKTSGAAFADMLLGHLAKPISAAQAAPENPIPPSLIYTTYYYSQVKQWVAYDAGRKQGSQQAYYQVSYTFQVFLDNKNNPQGNFQYVLAEADMTANPTNGTGDFLNMNATAGTDWDPNTYVEMAWFQSDAAVQVTPTNAQGWLLLDSSPTTANNQTDVTSSASFNIGFNTAQGVFGSYTFGSSSTQRIQDWKVENESSGTTARWEYSSAYPIDSTRAYDGYGCDQPMFGKTCYIVKPPNDLSLNTLELSTKAVWQTPSVIDKWVSFATYSFHGMLDVYCAQDNAFSCSDAPDGSNGYSLGRSGMDTLTDFSVNLGAVVPIPIKSLTFKPNPVAARQAVTGTITLDSPAQVDTPITLTSNSQNATVLPTVTVKQGQQTADFQVLTNANNLSSGEKTTATIAAFYATDFQAQLTVEAP